MADESPRDTSTADGMAARKAAVDARLDEAVRTGAPIREVYDLFQQSACLFEAMQQQQSNKPVLTEQGPRDT